MSLFRVLFAAAIAVGLTTAPALADARPRPESGRQGQAADQPGRMGRDADRAFRDTQQGRSMPLPQIERRVMPFMGGADYLGPEINGDSYRLKFMQNGRVIWVDVDGQSGRIIRRSRP
jgi:hypothetical protein